jgi:hypothetical protein
LRLNGKTAVQNALECKNGVPTEKNKKISSTAICATRDWGKTPDGTRSQFHWGRLEGEYGNTTEKVSV